MSAFCLTDFPGWHSGVAARSLGSGFAID
jgi:hypothetical protein